MSEIAQSPASGNAIVGIWMKMVSVALFVAMSGCLKSAEGIPSGELTFFRSFFGIFPVFVWLWWRGQLHGAFYTRNILGHFWRGLFGVLAMLCNFYALTLLPLPETIAIGYGAPLILVILCAIFLNEKVRLYRWSAVIIGLGGVLIIIWPRMTLFSSSTLNPALAVGAAAALVGAILTAIALLLVRRLVFAEKTETIVIYFMLSASVISLVTLPFGWVVPDARQAALLITAGIFGGIAQIFMTEAYRYAEPSTVAPFEYSSLVLGLLLGYIVFGDVPTLQMLLGSAVVIASGIFIIYRESRLNKKQ